MTTDRPASGGPAFDGPAFEDGAFEEPASEERVAGPSWRALWDQATVRLGGDDQARLEARFIVEAASGCSGAELAAHLDAPSTALTHASWERKVERRAAGEPLQYVLGDWAFRSLDLLVDRRVLIPRPETEYVVEVALAELDRRAVDRPVVVDLGTGSGAIGLSIAVERPATSVWLTDRSPEALAVAQANLAGVGRAATRVRLAHGSWFEALPADLAGACTLIIANPPYVATGDEVPDEVAGWEPHEALFAGPTGLDDLEVLIAQAPRWLAESGVLVLEIGETQGAAVVALAGAAGLEDARVVPDLTGRDRMLVAHRP